MFKIGGKKTEKDYIFPEWYRALTLSNSVRTLFRSTREGADLVRSSVTDLAITVRSDRVERFENYDQACDRQRLGDREVAIARNALVLQSYVGFFCSVALLAMCVNLCVSASVGLLAAVLGLASVCCLLNAIQASLNAFKITRRRLDVLSEWCASPAEWFPSRTEAPPISTAGDSRLSPAMILASTARCRRYFVIGAAFLVLGAVGRLSGGLAMPGLHWMPAVVGVCFAVMAVAESLRVMQGVLRAEVDFVTWAGSPRFWLPHPAKKIKSTVPEN